MWPANWLASTCILLVPDSNSNPPAGNIELAKKSDTKVFLCGYPPVPRAVINVLSLVVKLDKFSSLSISRLTCIVFALEDNSKDIALPPLNNISSPLPKVVVWPPVPIFLVLNASVPKVKFIAPETAAELGPEPDIPAAVKVLKYWLDHEPVTAAELTDPEIISFTFCK